MKKITSTKIFQNFKFIYTLITLTLVFSLVITSSVAWWVKNKNLSSSDMNMGLDIDDTSAEYFAYMYDMENNKGIDHNSDGEVITITNLDMNQYDTLFRSKNKYTPAFAKIRITRNEAMEPNGTLHLKIDRRADDLLDDDTNYTSRIARFTIFTISDKDILEMTDPNLFYTTINNDTRYNEIKGYKGVMESSKAFVSATGVGEEHRHEKFDSITLSLDYTSNDWYTYEGDNTDTLNVFLYISYDEELIDCYMNEELDNEISFMDAGIEFHNDFEKITISYDNQD